VNYFLKCVCLLLIVQVGVIIGANIPKPALNSKFSGAVLDTINEQVLSEFIIKTKETIKDTKGIGLGKGIIQYEWALNFKLGIQANGWAFNSQYENHIVYIDAPELIWLQSDMALVKQTQLDATSDERNARMFEKAKSKVASQLHALEKELLKVDSLYYQHAKLALEKSIHRLLKKQSPHLIIEHVVIRNWPE